MNEIMHSNEALFISLSAFCIVILILVLMAFFMHSLGWSVKLIKKFRQRREEETDRNDPEHDEQEQAGSFQPDEETVAAITAAIACVTDSTGFRVADIRPAQDSSGWISAGRNENMGNRWSRR